MANISFLDLMFAEALASGLARESRRAAPPGNFFLLPRDGDGWRKIRDASKRENMVVCIEFTDNSNDNCLQVQRVFMDLAREFDGIPFIRAVIGLGSTFDDMRADLGGVQYTPTILMVFYGDDSVSRAKFEGTGGIRDGLATGKIKGVIKELVDRRVKLKLAERLAEGLAQQVKSQLSDKERSIREQYETRLERQMSEKEKEFRKKEEERKKNEERKEEEKDRKRRLANDQLRQERPQHLDELFKLNLDSAPIKELKKMMEKMGISPRGCLDRQDLKEKLHANVPELRLRESGQEQQAKIPPRGSESLGGMLGGSEPLGGTLGGSEPLGGMLGGSEPLGGMLIEKETLKQMTAKLKNKDMEIASLKAQLKKAPSVLHVVSDESLKVKKLEETLLETRMLYTTTLQDFDLMDLIHDPVGGDDDSVILRAKCIKPGIPSKDRTYAVKVLTNYFVESTQTKIRQDHENEYQVLCRLPPHQNIIHMWAFFYDRPGPNEIRKYFKRAGWKARGMCLFILMDEHPTSMADHLEILVENRGPLSTKVVDWLKDLLSGLVFLERQSVVHRDLKLNNLLLTAYGRMIICDFGKAIAMEPDDHFTMKYTSGGTDIGGNRAHLAPEILTCRAGPRSFLNYSKQPVWAVGVLAYELAGHPSPFETIDQKGYDVKDLPPLKVTRCNNPSYRHPLPPQLTTLVESMLYPDPYDRPSLQHCLDSLNNI